MRDPHYIKIASAVDCPSQIVCVDCETTPDKQSTATESYHKLTLGCALSYRLEQGERTRIKQLTFREVSTFWEWLQSILTKQRTTWVFAHNAAYDLGILDAWRIFSTDPEWGFRKVIVERGIVLLDGEYEGKRVIFCDTLNYFKCKLADLAKMVGMTKMEMPDTSIDSPELETYCRHDVEITAATVDKLINLIRNDGYGPWGPTQATLAYNTWRKCFLEYRVLVHDNEKVLKLERNGYYGGIVDTPFIGECPASPIFELDVVSMYPSVCLGNLPARFKDATNGATPEWLRSTIVTDMCIADVTIETDQPVYPYRIPTGTIYPVGTFRTTLAHAELLDALSNDRVKIVHHVASYTQAPIFYGYMVHFLAGKIKANKEGDIASESLYKYLLNSLYGKTGQISPRWREVNDDTIDELSKMYNVKWDIIDKAISRAVDKPTYFWQISIPDIGLVLDARSLFGCVEVLVRSTETWNSCPAIAACVTSAARVKLREYQRTAGNHHYYYSDTDSLWVDTQGLCNLVNAGYVRDEVGFLQIKGKCDCLTVYGRKDYHAENYSKRVGSDYIPKGEIIKRKGVRGKAVQVGPNTFEQEKWPSVLSQLYKSTPGYVVVETITKTLHRTVTHCHVSGSGWTTPLVINGE